MQTFLPYPDFLKSAKCLDYRRLGKQRVEAKQILDILLGLKPLSGWRHHPAVKMWRGYENALKLYHNTMIMEWMQREYKNNMDLYSMEYPVIYPMWFGDVKFHAAHRSNLLRKSDYYRQFGWTESNNLPYIWP